MKTTKLKILLDNEHQTTQEMYTLCLSVHNVNPFGVQVVSLDVPQLLYVILHLLWQSEL